MDTLFNGKMKYLFLAPIVLLIIFALLNLRAVSMLSNDILEGWLIAVMFVQMITTFLVNMAFVILLSYLGKIYSSRAGSKWR